jgi:hypothetical protein
MDPRPAATRVPDPDAVEFIRFCYRRRRVGWPELYDEMCAVAGRGLFHGYNADDLAARGIGFGLFEMPALAGLAREIVAEEQASRRPVAVMIRADDDVATVAIALAVAIAPAVAVEPVTPIASVVEITERTAELSVGHPVMEPAAYETHPAEPVTVARLVEQALDRSSERPARSEAPIRFATVPAGA